MKPDESTGNIAITNDGGKTWTAGSYARLPIARLRTSQVPIFAFATGTSGSDWSSTEAEHGAWGTGGFKVSARIGRGIERRDTKLDLDGLL